MIMKSCSCVHFKLLANNGRGEQNIHVMIVIFVLNNTDVLQVYIYIYILLICMKMRKK